MGWRRGDSEVIGLCQFHLEGPRSVDPADLFLHPVKLPYCFPFKVGTMF